MLLLINEPLESKPESIHRVLRENFFPHSFPQWNLRGKKTFIIALPRNTAVVMVRQPYLQGWPCELKGVAGILTRLSSISCLGVGHPFLPGTLLFLAGVCPWLRMKTWRGWDIRRTEASCHPLKSAELFVQALPVPRTEADLEVRCRWPNVSSPGLSPWVYELLHFPRLRRHAALAHLWAA